MWPCERLLSPSDTLGLLAAWDPEIDRSPIQLYHLGFLQARELLGPFFYALSRGKSEMTSGVRHSAKEEKASSTCWRLLKELTSQKHPDSRFTNRECVSESSFFTCNPASFRL